MTELIQHLFYMVDEWVDQHYIKSAEAKKLLAQRAALQEEMSRRLGEDGWDMLETLSDLNLRLEDIHGEALFRAAMELGTRIAHPRRSPRTAERPQ